MELVGNILIDNNSQSNIINVTHFNNTKSLFNDPAYCKTIGGYSDIQYQINVTISLQNGNQLSAGPSYPTGSLNVGQTRRVIMTKNGTLGIMTVTVW